MAIIYPFRQSTCIRTHWRVTLIAVWTVGACLAVPQYLYSEATLLDADNTTTQVQYSCVENWPNTDLSRGYSLLIFIVTYGIPLICLTVLYGTICCRMTHAVETSSMVNSRDELNQEHHNRVIRLHMSAAQKQQRRRQRVKVIKMLILIVGFFALAWLPLQTFNLIYAFTPDLLVRLVGHFGQPTYMTLFLACHWLAMSHSCVNPVIYCFMSDTFRVSFYLFKFLHCLDHFLRLTD